MKPADIAMWAANFHGCGSDMYYFRNKLQVFHDLVLQEALEICHKAYQQFEQQAANTDSLPAVERKQYRLLNEERALVCAQLEDQIKDLKLKKS